VLDDRRGTLDGPDTEYTDIDEASKQRLEDLGYF
jgi:hypothetical protein